MSLILLFPCLLFAVVGHSLLSSATDIAIRRKGTVWETARPEFGGALLCYFVAFLCAAIAGGAL